MFTCKNCGSNDEYNKHGQICYECKKDKRKETYADQKHNSKEVNSFVNKNCKQCVETNAECNDCYSKYMGDQFGYSEIDPFQPIDPTVMMKNTTIAVDNYHLWKLTPQCKDFLVFLTEATVRPDRLKGFNWYRSKLPITHWLYKEGHYAPPTYECFQRLMLPGYLEMLAEPVSRNYKGQVTLTA